MKKRFYCTLSLLLAMAMVFSMLPMSAVTQVAATGEAPLVDQTFESFEVGASATETGEFAGGKIFNPDSATDVNAEIVEVNGNKVLHMTSGSKNFYYGIKFDDQTQPVTLSYSFALGTNKNTDMSKSSIYFPTLLKGSSSDYHYNANTHVADIGTNKKGSVTVDSQVGTWLYDRGVSAVMRYDANSDGTVADNESIAKPAVMTWHTIKLEWTPASGDAVATTKVYYDGYLTDIDTINNTLTSVNALNMRMYANFSSEIWLDNIKVTVGDHAPEEVERKCWTACTMVDGTCSVCGYTVPAPEYTYTHTGSTMVLGDNLNVRFFINETPAPDGAHYAKIEKTVPGGDPEVTTIPQSQWEYHSDHEKYYVEYTGMAAKEMGQTFTVTYYDENDQAISEVKTFKAKDYLEGFVDDGEQSQQLKDVCRNLLIYGAAAQDQFNDYDIENVVTSDTPATSNATDTSSRSDSAGTSLVLESTIEMRVFFSADKLENAAKWTVEYTDHYGDPKSDEGTAFVDTEFVGRTEKFVPVTGLSIADINTEVTVTVYDANDELLYTVKDSMASYVARMGNAGIYAALYNVGTAAAAYFQYLEQVNTQVTQTASYAW